MRAKGERFDFDFDNERYLVDGEVRELQATPAKVLQYLARKPMQVIDRDELMLAALAKSPGGDELPGLVDVHVSRIRKAFHPWDPIFTARGRGYRWDCEVEWSDAGVTDAGGAVDKARDSAKRVAARESPMPADQRELRPVELGDEPTLRVRWTSESRGEFLEQIRDLVANAMESVTICFVGPDWVFPLAPTIALARARGVEVTVLVDANRGIL